MSISILKTGPLATIQDLGRYDGAQWGVPLAGVMDIPASLIGNLLVGNSPELATLEITLGGFSARFECDTVIALTGAVAPATLDKQPIGCWRNVPVRAGQKLKIDFAPAGARIYLSVSGGVDVPMVLGARATDLAGHFGGLNGRALKAGDVVPLGQLTGPAPDAQVRAPERGDVLRVLPATEWSAFSPAAQQALLTEPWRVTPDANRMGANLAGPVLELGQPLDLSSHAVQPGVLQVPPSGHPILLLPDAQTTGGYPKIAQVIRADLWRTGQFRPGDTMRFVEVTLEQALAALAEQRRWLAQLENQLKWRV
ncbi:biotin-dependent carboxyltransferase family protein [Silvimonas sp.]|uniref:5-oxoprolinase subunit C family protein n=1 Tax=Silvimonas sp. TaxID=2650811 RepID=UPI00283EE7F6|nr:biotin-dependent carboxyltransferase family protein [Silvimonas sp.]MDR3427117.1 biotin-dependent carboxyltransferase family protein [Silvimonas sp.]